MNRNGRIAVITVALLIVSVLVGWRIYVRLDEYLQELDSQIAHLRVAGQRLDQARRDNEVYLEKWVSVNAFMNQSTAEREAGFERYLQQLQTERTFSLATFGTPSVRAESSNPRFAAMSFDLTFYAQLEDLVAFLESLDHSEELLRVDRLRITRPATFFSPPRYSAELGPAGGRSDELSVEVVITVPAVAESTVFSGD